MKYQIKWKELGIDLIVDIIASMLIAVGIYNFALNANFPVAGFSGIAIILYHLFGLPVGAGTLLLNVPVAIFCYKFLGRTFFLKSVKTMIISSVFLDYIAPMFPVYDGNRLLAALCMGGACRRRVCNRVHARLFHRRTGLHQHGNQEGKAPFFFRDYHLCAGYDDNRAGKSNRVQRHRRLYLWNYRNLPHGNRNGPYPLRC